MPDRLEVDLAGLDDLACRLDRVCVALDGAKAFFSGYDAALGDDDVIGAVHHFQSHWKDGRKHIIDDAATLKAMAADSAQAYRDADDQLANSFTSEQQPPGGGQ